MNLELPILFLGIHKPEVVTIKVLLNQLGYSIPIFDQLFSRATEYALQKFQKANGMEPSGICDVETWMLLIKGGKHNEETKKH